MTRVESPLVVRRRGEHVDLVLGNVVLLSSAALETERAFGAITPADAKRVLIGGLGFGATLRGALGVVSADARVHVVEKVAAIEPLLRGELAHLAQGVLEDPRITLENADVVDVLARERDLDAILLDVDNGPEWASFRTNARIYSPAGLAAAHAALRPGGMFAVWSGYAADPFLARLRAAQFTPSILPFRERGIVRARAYVGVKGLDSPQPSGDKVAP
jgi:predicted membrane-bound spermidine synthase